MNSSGVWLNGSGNKQLPTPVILPDTFVDHKKILLNSPKEENILKLNDGNINQQSTSNKDTTTTNRSIIDVNYYTSRCSTNGRLLSPALSLHQMDTSNQNNGINCPKNYLSYRYSNSYSLASLNTPVASRSIPYKRSKEYDSSNGLINLSKNELDTSLYDPSKNLRFIDQSYNLSCVIDKGTFSEVYLAQSKIDGKYYAIKVVSLIQKHNIVFKYNEVQILDYMPPHTNIVHFFSAWRDSDYLFIKTELCLDNFSNMLVIKRMEENELLIFLAHSLCGLKYIHSFNIIHMDIKSSNILLGIDGMYKIADFGLATFANQVKDFKYGVSEGDSRYMAPELLNSVATLAADLFSLGMALVEAIFNINLPVDGCLWHRLRQGMLPNYDFDSIKYSEQLYYCTKQLISPKPEDRPSIDEILQWDTLKQAITKKSTYLDILKPHYETCVSNRNNSSDSLYSPNVYQNNSNNLPTCSTPMIFGKSIKKSRLDSPLPIERSYKDDDNSNSDVIELNFSD